MMQCTMCSRDSIAFVNHDDSLDRTTNVEKVFPSRKFDAASSFTITETQQLDAGSWFLQVSLSSVKSV